MKILILRFSSIGDIVLTTPVIRCLKKKFPDAQIHYATKKSFHSILQHNPYLSKIHLLEESVSALVNKLKAEKFDYVIDLHHNQRTTLIKFLLGVKSFSFNKINLEKWLMVNFKINRLPQKHIVDRYLDTCTALGVENDGEGLDYFISEEENAAPKSLPEDYRQDYIAWAIGAKQNTKKYPTAKIIAALSSVDFNSYPVVLLGGKEDTADATKIAEAVQQRKPSARVYNACGAYSLNKSAALVKHARLVIANDTGLMHIASAFKKPLITIWGNTIPEFGMSPYKANELYPQTDFQVMNLSCRPCSKLGYTECPQNHFNCMRLQNNDELVAAINRKPGTARTT